MAKPASLLFFGFYLVLVMSMSSEGVSAVKCRGFFARQFGSGSLAEEDFCVHICESIVKNTLVSVQIAPFGCKCCHK
ncbi:hypothetical protein MKW98_013402 [Papaver atlanticum]|uniref:Uncharacterized protein n=1 Tax=Papaver atlanticum TaxID=357466 RepID=A0AAD4XIT9_9MAGN|nr:hypothetical protein MKW98_013402 [Papaver atlanticum]